ncbi:MAG: chemotaxis protein CheW [Thermaerobacter sp.]|nr:chemotaxis protein CheW [Thermaerobacter sp.]
MSERHLPDGNPHPADPAGTGSAQTEETVNILRERAIRLAEPLPSSWRQTRLADLLVFQLGGTRFGIETALVAEVVSHGAITPVPGTPPFLLGVGPYRGRIVAVIDLRAWLDVDGRPLPPDFRVVVVTVAGMTFGLAVDSVEGVVRDDAGQRFPVVSPASAEGTPFVREMTGNRVGVLDLDGLCRSGRFVVNDGV